VLSSRLHGRPFGHNRLGPKFGGYAPWGGAGSASNTMLPGPRPTIVPSGILIHPAVWSQQTWPKIGGCAPFLGGGGAGSPSNTMSLGSRSTFLLRVASWSIEPFGHNRYGPRIGGGLCPFKGRAPGSLSHTMWPVPRPNRMPSFTLIRPTVWPQYTNVTDRTDSTVYIQRSDSTGRTVLQNGRPKTFINVGNIRSAESYDWRE